MGAAAVERLHRGRPRERSMEWRRRMGASASYASFARRMPLNCQRASGGKKLR